MGLRCPKRVEAVSCGVSLSQKQPCPNILNRDFRYMKPVDSSELRTIFPPLKRPGQ